MPDPVRAPDAAISTSASASASVSTCGGSPTPAPAAPDTYVVAVRALCEFTARRGDLDLRFTPAPSAQEGQAGHLFVTQRRGAGYETEVSLAGTHGPLRVRGRADGYDTARNRLEEIKTHRGSVDRIPDNHRALHWAQAKVYAHLLCEQRGLDAMDVALVYFDIGTQQETVLVETHDADALRAFFTDQCERFIAWARQEMVHRQSRDAALASLAFPHGEFRAGQRDLAKAVFRAGRDAHCVLAQAPTGIGKTMATIFPMLKACVGTLDKVFFLCAKTAGRQSALAALQRLRAADGGPPLRVLEMVAREQACEHPASGGRGNACNGDACRLARGFHDRLPAARATALQDCFMDRAAVRTAALAHDVCPYFLSQELARWSDVVVGDYNYYFDGSAMLHAMTVAYQWRVGLLVDEAHNMVERARRMYTAELRLDDLAAARRAAPVALRKPLDALRRIFRQLLKAQTQPYTVYDDMPPALLEQLQQTGSALSAHFAEQGGEAPEPLLQLYFAILSFARLAEDLGDHALFDITLAQPGETAATRGQGQGGTLCVRNVVPGPYLSPRFKAAHGAVLFSATLNPMAFYRDTLGLPGDCRTIDVPGPFRAEQLAVHLVGNVSTRYRDRDASISAIVEIMARAYREHPGNYICFASSFEYMDRLACRLRSCAPDLPSWQQAAGMDAAGRVAFLDRFAPGGAGLGFAVLGGVFGEGVDLPGDRLIGAFIVTLGMPQVNPVNEQMMRRMDARFGCGFEYTYLYPGLQKVVQAAGRVIRTETDRGSVYLIDDRFRRANVRALLPAWWRPRRLDHPAPEHLAAQHG
ncbi:ATP-dependent DNA helicase [Bordetella genomosp. 9]|uniref:ATP-dependent DNA helicase n=1 Tax=Bordetella genomosp. 9 TaxID=1416803 RepID=A0A261REX4_9BORD|nr:helicase C-terminal domain-containing protein [Bordetella genomosp. 9]OZI23170.1 ATP-dependent DNA helicase [Bordetella genomosp. 9]